MNKNIKSIQRVEETDDIKKYYDELIKKIVDDWQNKKYVLAIQRLEEELDQPYIPFNYEELMSDMLFSYKRELKFLTIDESVKKMSMDEMLSNIFVNDNFNIFIFELFIQKYGSQLSDKHFPIIQLWLQSNKISNEDKFLILDSLAAEGIDKNFIFYNFNVNNDVVVNTLTYRDSEYLNKYKLALDKIANIVNKDQVVANFCSNIVECCANYYFPEFPFSSIDSFAYSVVKIINKFMNFEEVEFSNLNNDEKIIYKIVEYIEKQECLN